MSNNEIEKKNKIVKNNLKNQTWIALIFKSSDLDYETEINI
jgi:hypothetical protein